MNRVVTAADIQKLGYEDRLPLALQFKRASLNPALSARLRFTYRLAARFVLGNVDSAAYDVLARLQILEGAAGVVSLKPMVAGPWSRNPRQGLKSAQDYFAGTAIDPTWFSTTNTGLISKVRGMVRQEFSKWTRGREVHFDPDDIIQNGLMGLTKDGEGQLSQGPLMIQFGHANTGVRKAIPEGRVSPTDVAGIVGKFFVQKVSDQFQMMDRSRAPAEDAAGRSVLDQQTHDQRSEEDILADALSDPSHPIRKMIFQALQQKLGDGKWAEVAMTFLEAQANGETVNKGEMAAQFGMAGGTFSKILREKVYPALEAIKRDHRIQEALEDYAERMQRRFARRKNQAPNLGA